MAILRQERKRSFMTLPAYIRAYIDGRAWRGSREEGSFSPLPKSASGNHESRFLA